MSANVRLVPVTYSRRSVIRYKNTFERRYREPLIFVNMASFGFISCILLVNSP